MNTKSCYWCFTGWRRHADSEGSYHMVGGLYGVYARQACRQKVTVRE